MKHPLISGLDWLSRIIFVLPVMVLALVFLWTMVFGESTRPRHSTTGDCSIPGVAEGNLFEIVETKDGKTLVSKGCGLQYLPAHWKYKYTFASKECIAPNGDIGTVMEVPGPGSLGFNRPRINVCRVTTFTQVSKEEARQ